MVAAVLLTVEVVQVVEIVEVQVEVHISRKKGGKRGDFSPLEMKLFDIYN